MPLSIIRSIWKGKWVVLLIWMVVTLLSFLVIRQIPSEYSAEALVLVDAQKIPEKYVSSTVNTDVKDRLSTIARQILSTERLKKLIADLGLYGVAAGEPVPDAMVEAMRSKISIQLDRGWSGELTAFRVGFQGDKPRVVAEVANRLSAFFVEENLKDRELQAEGTAEFIESQLREAKKRLDEQEAAVSQYKAAHSGELPGQEAALLGTIGRYQAELNANTEAANRARQTKLMLENNLSLAEAALEAAIQSVRESRDLALRAAAQASSEPAAEPVRGNPEIERLQAQIANLRTRYSDDHPDVVRAQRTLQKLIAIENEREKVASMLPAPPARPKSAATPAQPPVREPLPVIQARERVQAIQSQIALTEKEIQARAAEHERIRQDMARLQAKLDRLPFREQEMSALTRDYEISRTNYQTLLGKKLAAEMATDLERRQKSQRFTIIDPARIPERPFKPKRIPLLLMSSAVGFAFGVLLAVGNEARRGVLLGEWELPAGTPVMGRLPRITLGKADHRRDNRSKIRKAAVAGTTTVAALAAWISLRWS